MNNFERVRARREQVTALARAGVSYDEIAEALGMAGRNSISGMVRHLRDGGVVIPTRRTIRAAHPCQLPGCDNPRSVTARYCSEQCRRDAYDHDLDARQIARLDISARTAPRAHPCHGCPGGFYWDDERGDRWCGCGRTFEMREAA